VARGKRKKTSTKKRKRELIEAEVAQAMADAADHAKRGGRGSGIQIGECHFHLEGVIAWYRGHGVDRGVACRAGRGVRGANVAVSTASSLKTDACSGDP
jgi:hypothetical protein